MPVRAKELWFLSNQKTLRYFVIMKRLVSFIYLNIFVKDMLEAHNADLCYVQYYPAQTLMITAGRDKQLKVF